MKLRRTRRSRGGGGQRARVRGVAARTVAPQTFPSSLHISVQTSPLGSSATHPWSGKPGAVPSPGRSRESRLGRCGMWPTIRIDRSLPSSSSRIHRGGSPGCRPWTAANAACGLQACRKSCAVWIARILPLCQIRSGLTPRAAAVAARAVEAVMPLSDNGRMGSTAGPTASP